MSAPGADPGRPSTWSRTMASGRGVFSGKRGRPAGLPRPSSTGELKIDIDAYSRADVALAATLAEIAVACGGTELRSRRARDEPSEAAPKLRLSLDAARIGDPPPSLERLRARPEAIERPSERLLNAMVEKGWTGRRSPASSTGTSAVPIRVWRVSDPIGRRRLGFPPARFRSEASGHRPALDLTPIDRSARADGRTWPWHAVKRTSNRSRPATS